MGGLWSLSLPQCPGYTLPSQDRIDGPVTDSSGDREGRGWGRGLSGSPDPDPSAGHLSQTSNWGHIGWSQGLPLPALGSRPLLPHIPSAFHVLNTQTANSNRGFYLDNLNEKRNEMNSVYENEHLQRWTEGWTYPGDSPSTAHAAGSTQDQEANITPWDPEPAQGRRLETWGPCDIAPSSSTQPASSEHPCWARYSTSPGDAATTS